MDIIIQSPGFNAGESLEVPGNDLFVKKNSQYFETSVSECVDGFIATD